ncbi:hypothetical protein [Georgenia thermotolerans]|uniref:hypothetical protein n=1 Tax=Georgenia thermotolerans TaxID=527326 RepID=UPI001264730D|nr:hypothetical protein [Georgenia thermotolerans]
MENSKPSLRDIADLAVARNGGRGGRALGRAAEARGLTLSYTTVDKIRAGTYLSKPSRKTLDALAELSGESRQVVYEAAGVPFAGTSFADNLPEDADLLDPEQRRIVYDVVRMLARLNRELFELRQRQEEVTEHALQRSAPMTTGSAGSGGALDGATDPADGTGAGTPQTPAAPDGSGANGLGIQYGVPPQRKRQTRGIGKRAGRSGGTSS